MGTSHIESDLVGNVSVTVASVTATNLVVGTKSTIPTGNFTTLASAPTVRVGSKIKMGTRQYIFFGTKSNSALVVADATNIAGTASVKGSLYISKNATKAALWLILTDTTSSIVGKITT